MNKQIKFVKIKNLIQSSLVPVLEKLTTKNVSLLCLIISIFPL